jgi:alkylated DNA repair dioxygenase AlkB
MIKTILIPKLNRIAAMSGCVPNDANAIDYRRKHGNALTSHVDDRKKHKEPIANLSLAGSCYMTFRNQNRERNLAVEERRVLLRPRTLQVLTGKARYDFSHGIANNDLLSDRRVSLTIRETPWKGRP